MNTTIRDHEMHEHPVKTIFDWISLSIAGLSLASLLPAIASLLSIVWTGIRIYEWSKGRKNTN